MKTKLILFILFQTLLCSGQSLNFNGQQFDLNKLDFNDKYFTTKTDTIGITDKYGGTLVAYSFGVYASNQREYFLIHFDTVCIGPLNIPTGCDSPTETDLFYYHRNKLLWKEHRANTISGVHFFEDNGSSIITWEDAWTENFHLLYDKGGKIVDSFSIKKRISDLDNNRKILVEHHNAKYNKATCIDNNGQEIWSNEFLFDDKNKRRFYVTNNGDRYMFEYLDSIVVFSSNHKFLFQINNPDFNSSVTYLHSGDFFFKNIITRLENKRIQESHVLVYDNSRGDIISKIDTLRIKDSPTSRLYAHPVKNSDNLYFVDLDRQNRIYHVLITNIRGKDIARYSSSKAVYSILLTESGYEIYGSKNLITTIKN